MNGSKIPFIVLACSMMYNAVSGGDRIFVEISKRFSHEAVNVTVLTTKTGKELWERSNTLSRIETLPPIRIENNPGRILVPLIYLYRSLRSLSYLRLFATAVDRPVFYSSSDFLPDVLGPFFLRVTNRNTVWISRVYHIIPSPSRRKGNLFLNVMAYFSQRFSLQLMKKANVIVALNSSVYRQLVAKGIPKTQVAISGAGVDIRIIDSVHFGGQKIYDGAFLGRIDPNKGIFDLLEIWQKVVSKKHDAKLLIIGSGEASIADLFRKKIREFGLERNIDCVGYVRNDADVYRLLKSTRIFLFTDHEAGWSLASCEAMACGLPVVAYNLQYFGSVFQKGFIGVPLFDKSQFADTVLMLLNDDAIRLALGAAARHQAEQYDWKHVSNDFWDLINKYWQS